MSIELSPSQERRLHSILDRGLEALHESSETNSRSSPGIKKDVFGLSNSYQDSPHKASPKESEKSGHITSELKFLQEKLATLEAKLANPSEVSSRKSSNRKKASPATSFKYTPRSSSRESNSRSSVTKNESYDRIKNIETSEKEIKKLERSITSSPSRKKSINNSREIEKIRLLVEKERKLGEKLRKENESLKKELNKRDDLKNTIAKLQDDYNELAISFERSESVRKKQKELINHLKNEIKKINESNYPDHIPAKTRKNKIIK
jgi:chromosome segregation ATPase